jgi:hypothetical protein
MLLKNHNISEKDNGKTPRGSNPMRRIEHSQITRSE